MTLTLEGVDDCTAAIPSIKKTVAGLVALPEAQVTVTAGAGCDDSRRRQLSGGKEFNIEMEGSDAQINTAETTVKAPDFIPKMNAAFGAIAQGNDHPMAGVSATEVSEPMKTAVTNSRNKIFSLLSHDLLFDCVLIYTKFPPMLYMMYPSKT